MKQLSVTLNIVLIAGIVFYACQNKTALTATQGNGAAVSSVTCDNNAFQSLPIGELLKGIARYRKTHWDKINGHPHMQQNNLQDARACWYAIDTLKKYICLIEKYSSRLRIPHDSLGIRFYYATYPDKDVWEPLYKSHHTLFMVPTYRNGGNDNLDFDPRYFANKQNFEKGTTLYDIYNSDSTANLMVLDGSTANAATRSLARNQGQLCPPTCPLTRTTLSLADARYPGGLDYQQ